MDDLRKRVYDATLGKLKQSLSDNRGFVRQGKWYGNTDQGALGASTRKAPQQRQTLINDLVKPTGSRIYKGAQAGARLMNPALGELQRPNQSIFSRNANTLRDVRDAGAGLATVAGFTRLPATLGMTAFGTALTSGMRASQGQPITSDTLFQDTIQNLNRSIPTAGILRGTGPLITAGVNKLTSNIASPVAGALAERGTRAALNVGEGLAIDQATGLPTTMSSVALDTVFGLAGKSGRAVPIDNSLANAKGLTRGDYIDARDMEIFDQSVDVIRNKKKFTPDQLQQAVDFVRHMGEGYLDPKKLPDNGDVNTIIREVQKISRNVPSVDSGIKLGIKGADDVTDTLTQQARKYKSAEEFQIAVLNDMKSIGKGVLEPMNSANPLKSKYANELKQLANENSGLAKKMGNQQATDKVFTDIWNKANEQTTQLSPNTQSGKARTQSKQKLGSDPAFSSSDGSIPKTPTGNPIRDDVTGVNPSGIGTRIREAVQDSWIRVKNLQRQKGAVVEDGGNPYLAEELYHGRIGARLEDIKTTVKSIDEDILKTSKEIGVPDAQLKKDVNTYLQALHAPERNKVHGDGAAGMTTKEARAILSQMTKGKTAKQVQRIAGQIKDMNKRTLDVLYEGQVIDKQMYDTLTTTYKNHVPLNRIMDETDNFGDILSGKGFNVKGTGVKRAKGSDKEVADIFTNVVANVEAALVKAEKNRVDLATLKFARNNPQLGIFEEIKPRAIGEGFDGKILTQQVTDPMVLTLRENGKPVYLKIKDERLAKVFQGIGQERLPDVFRFVNTFTRFYSGLHTRFNPEFALSNVVRDSQEMAVYMASQNNVGFKGAGKAVMDMPKSQKAVIDALRGMDTEGAKLYKQMQMDGGTTGGQALSTRKQVDVDMQEIMRINRSAPKKAAQKILESFDNWNTVFEDGTRLAVYKRALDSGLSREQAASMAKNSTVNFNKKGTAGPIVNSLYMFSNASIQGSTKMLRAMKNPKVAGVVTTAVGGSVFAINSWNDSVDPDWRDKVTEWDRNSNMVVMLPSSGGDAKYLTIPVSWGIKPIKVAADTAYDLSTGHANDIGDAAVKIASSAFDAYNPAGGTDAMSIVTPTILDTPLDISRNTAWHGGSIKPDWLKGLPGSEQHFKDIEESPSGRIAKGITDKASGMGIEVSPDDLLYAYNAYIGGVGKFATRITSTATSLMQGDDLVAKDVPFINRFYKERSAEQVESSVAYQKEADFMESLKKYETGSEEQKSAIENYLRQRGTKEERQSILFKLRDQGIPTKGISFSAKKLGITDASTDTPFTAPATFQDTDDMPQNIIEKIALAAEGATKDPKNTIKAIVTQEELRKIEGDAVILKRQDFLNKADDPSLARDHIIPLGLGGDNSEANLQYVDKEWHDAKTKNDNKLIRKLQSGQISRKEAQKQVQTWLEQNPVDRYVMDESEANMDVLETALYDEYDLGFLSKEPMTAVAKAKYEDKKYDKALSIYRDEEIDDDTRSTLLNTIGIDTNDLNYYDVASSENYIKSLHVREEISTIPDNNREQLLQKLAEMRRPVNRKYILADGVITDLVDEGVITKDEGKILKNIDFDSTGKLKVKVSGRGGGAKLKKVKFVPLSVNSAPIQNVNFEGLKTPSGMGQNRLSVPRLQVQNVRPQQQPKFQVRFDL